MTAVLFIMGIVAALAFAGLRLKFLRIALNLLPVAIGMGYAAYFTFSGHLNWAVIVTLVSLYATCPWWEYLDERIWMKKGVCRGF
jgi:hypothetical protein